MKYCPPLDHVETIISPPRKGGVQGITRANIACNQQFFRLLEFGIEALATLQENGEELGVGFPRHLTSSFYQQPRLHQH